MSSGATPAPGWCLRFLSGALRGRTIALRLGANVVGSAGECEVMLPGGDVQPRHLVVTAGELVVSIRRVGTAAVQVNGDDVTQQRRSVVAGDVLGIGGIEVQLDRTYAPVERDDDMFAPAQSVLPGANPAPDSGTPAPRPPQHVAAAALVVMALLGFVGLALRDAQTSSGGFAAGTVSLAEVDKVLANYPEVEAVAAAGGQVILRGYVESGARKAALREAMQPFGRGVTVNVHAAQDMVEQARRFIGDPGVAVSYAGQGRLVVSGTADDEVVRQRVRRLIEDLHPTVLVTDKVTYQEKPRRQESDGTAQWAAWQKILPARMVGITDDGNGLRHIQLSNGSRYYEGSVLRSGAELKRIDTDSLVLSGDGPPPDEEPN